MRSEEDDSSGWVGDCNVLLSIALLDEAEFSNSM